MDIPFWTKLFRRIYNLRMRIVLFIFLSASFPSFAGMKALFEAMHGDKMGVEYQVLNSGKHILLVQEKVGETGGRANFKQRQMIDLEMKKDEALSMHYGFRCTLEGTNYVYAVISKKRAKENDKFQPERAWRIDEKGIRLNRIEDPRTISCIWSPEGESAYPFR